MPRQIRGVTHEAVKKLPKNKIKEEERCKEGSKGRKKLKLFTTTAARMYKTFLVFGKGINK